MYAAGVGVKQSDENAVACYEGAARYSKSRNVLIIHSVGLIIFVIFSEDLVISKLNIFSVLGCAKDVVLLLVTTMG